MVSENVSVATSISYLDYQAHESTCSGGDDWSLGSVEKIALLLEDGIHIGMNEPE